MAAGDHSTIIHYACIGTQQTWKTHHVCHNIIKVVHSTWFSYSSRSNIGNFVSTSQYIHRRRVKEDSCLYSQNRSIHAVRINYGGSTMAFITAWLLQHLRNI